MKQIRHSDQRDLIYDVLEGKKDHPTADKIYERVRKREPKISRGTVYRNLNLLADMGKIKRLSMPIGPDHFDSTMERHYHFVCRECGRVFDAEIPYQDMLNETPDEMPGFRTEWHRLVLVGLCPACADAADRRSSDAVCSTDD